MCLRFTMCLPILTVCSKYAKREFLFVLCVCCVLFVRCCVWCLNCLFSVCVVFVLCMCSLCYCVFLDLLYCVVVVCCLCCVLCCCCVLVSSLCCVCCALLWFSTCAMYLLFFWIDSQRILNDAGSDNPWSEKCCESNLSKCFADSEVMFKSGV
jgi:hypothetical protein